MAAANRFDMKNALIAGLTARQRIIAIDDAARPKVHVLANPGLFSSAQMAIDRNRELTDDSRRLTSLNPVHRFAQVVPA